MLERCIFLFYLFLVVFAHLEGFGVVSEAPGGFGGSALTGFWTVSRPPEGLFVKMEFFPCLHLEASTRMPSAFLVPDHIVIYI